MFYDFSKKFTDLLETIPLSRYEKDVIISRYLKIVKDTENEYLFAKITFNILTNIITIFGVLSTCLLGIYKSLPAETYAATVIFWIIFAFSVCLTLANKWLSTFNIQKKYVLGVSSIEKLHNEGWCFLEGIEHYNGINDMTNKYKLFCSRIEKIRMKLVANMPELSSNTPAEEILATGRPDKYAVVCSTPVDDEVEIILNPE